MNILLLRRLVFTFVLLTLTVLLSGCVIGGGGYGYDGDASSYGATYYEPSGAYYGGWGHDYQVAPFRGGEHRPTAGGGHTAVRAFKPAAASHSAPSIPSRSSSGKSRSDEKRSR
jgi:hypothetical protein